MSDLAQQHQTATTSPLNPSACRALEKIKATLLALEKLIVYDLTTITNSDGRTEISTLAWIKSQSKVQALKAKIQSERVELNTALTILNT